MEKLSGKIALVTGGSSGIGLATAKRLVADGAFVFITGRRNVELDAAAAEIGKNVRAVQGDVANLADLDRLYATIEQEKGRIDVLFANAGVAEAAPLSEVTEAHFDRMFDINVKGVLFTVQKAIPLLTPNASILLNGSVVGSKGFPNRSVYSATKAALRSFARTWTIDLKGRARVNVISPGPTDTEGMRGLMGQSSEGLSAYFKDKLPLGRLGRPEDVANAVAFLASDDAAWITGVELFVDGGMGQV